MNRIVFCLHNCFMRNMNYTHLFGGSPFMTLLSAFRDTEYVCLTGFNLAMVIQMLQYDGDDLHELAEDIASIGKDVSIRLIPKIIPEEEQND